MVLLVDDHALDGGRFVRRENLAVFLVVVDYVRRKQGQVTGFGLGRHLGHAAWKRVLVDLEIVRLHGRILHYFLGFGVDLPGVVERKLVVGSHSEFE